MLQESCLRLKPDTLKNTDPDLARVRIPGSGSTALACCTLLQLIGEARFEMPNLRQTVVKNQ